MRLSSCFSYVLAAVLVVPAGLMASQQPCQTSAPTALSKTWNFPKEATELLKDVRAKAYAVGSDAEGLASLSRFDDVSWERNSSHIERIRDEVNAMGKDLCRLQEIRPVALPWQQREIDRITPKLQDMATQTQNSIKLLNANEHTFWATNFPNDMAAIRTDATQIYRSVVREIQYAKLQHELGLTSRS